MPVSLRQRHVRRPRRRVRGKPPDGLEVQTDGEGAEKLSGVHGSPHACAKRLEQLIETCFTDLQFLLDEFEKLEVLLDAERETADAAETDSKLGKLRLFTSHVRRTMTRMRAARSGCDPLSTPQLALLEDHITTSILPVKARLVRQLEGGGLVFPVHVDSTSGSDGASTHCESSSQVVSQDEVSADGGSTSRRSSDASSIGGFTENLSQGGEEGGGRRGGCAVGMELDDECFGVSLDATGGGRGGGGGWGLKSPDAGHDSRSPSLRNWSTGDSVTGRLVQHRRDQLDLLSQLEAEGVFAADDSYSPCRVDVTGDFLPLVVPVGTLDLEEPGLTCELAHATTTAEGGSRSIARDGSTGKVKQESGTGTATRKRYFDRDAVKEELRGQAPSTSPAEGFCMSQAFMGPTLTTTAASCAATQVFMGPMVTVATSRRAAAQAGSSSSAGTTGLLVKAPAERPVAAAGVPPRREPGSEEDKASTTCVVGNVSTCTSHDGKGNALAAGRNIVAGADVVAVGTGAGVPAASQQVGSPTAPVFAAAGAPSVPACALGASTRALGTAGGAVATAALPTVMASCAAGSGVAAIPPNPSNGAACVVGATGDGRSGMLVVPPRPAKRRKSSTFSAALLQPREVRYQCGYCLENYASTVTGNPWWLLVRQECPMCHQMQIPRVDILNPTNNVEGHIALLTEACAERAPSQNGSDGDGSCMGWDGDTSDDNSGDDYSGDESDLQRSSMPSLTGDGQGAGGGGSGTLRPTLHSEQAAKLLVLMCHARTCPGQHRSPRLAEVCRSVKFLMLHLRDCDGRTRTGQPCPMPWCQPCTALLHHLIQCPESAGCQVCNPLHLPSQLRELRTLNQSGNAQHAHTVSAVQGSRAGEHASSSSTQEIPVPFGQHAPDRAAGFG